MEMGFPVQSPFGGQFVSFDRVQVCTGGGGGKGDCSCFPGCQGVSRGGADNMDLEIIGGCYGKRWNI